MRFSLRKKILFPIILGLIIIGLVVFFAISSVFKNFYLNTISKTTAVLIKHHVGEALGPEDFSVPAGTRMQPSLLLVQKFESQRIILSDLLKKIGAGELIRVKIWDANFTVISSDNQDIIGLSFPDNIDLEMAYQGEVVTEIGKIEPNTADYEKEFREALEVYIPIKNSENKVVGVVETYQPTLTFKETLNKILVAAAASAGGGILAITLFTAFLLQIFVFRPIKEIRKASYPIGRGEFKGYVKVKQKDEIGDLAEDFNRMMRGLNSLSGEILRLKEITRLKSEFISITAHQLRTPLSGIKWVLELALEKETSEELKNWLLKIDELNERMIENINDLLNAARIEEGRFGYKFQEKINLISLLEKVAETYQIKIREKKLDFSFPKGRFKNLYLRADPEKLEIAFNNLMENAVDYTGEGGAIRVELEKPDGFVIIKIKDTGIGIAKEDLPRLFSKFFRGQNAISAQPNGSGIGLFIAKNIIETHRGEIWPESELNQGTTFYVKLPLVETKKEELEKFFEKV